MKANLKEALLSLLCALFIVATLAVWYFIAAADYARLMGE